MSLTEFTAVPADDLYHTPLSPKEMRAETTFSAVALKGDSDTSPAGTHFLHLESVLAYHRSLTSCSIT